MAARKPKAAAPSLFALAERQIVSLYDAGVLSPAVLQHVVAAYADRAIDWNESATLRSVDDHSMQEIVALVMMPGRTSRTAQKDFLSVVEHLAAGQAAQANSMDEEQEDDDALLDQLGGGQRNHRAKQSTRTSSKQPAGFNPLVGARAVPKR
jgi:hypothetical protein